MGAGQSSAAAAGHEHLLQKLAGPAEVAQDDPLWRALSNVQLPLASQPPAAVEDALAPHCRMLLVHNPITRNFQRLVLHCLDLASSAQAGQPTLAAANALHLVCVALKQMVDSCSPSTLTMVFEVAPNLPPAVQGQPSLLPMFINRLVLLVCNLQPSDALSYLVLLEALLLLLVAASTQLYSQQTAAPPGSQPLLEALMAQQQCAAPLVSALLQLVVARPPLPPKLALHCPPTGGGTSVMRLVATAAATVLWIPLRTYQYILRSGSSGSDGAASPLGDVALSLLLVLSHYPAHHAQLANGVKQGLAQLADAASDAPGGDGGGRASSPAPRPAGPAISFARLYSFFSTGPASEASTLLLYTLLHGSTQFRNYVLIRSDPELLLLPLLQQLYKANKGRANHLYMLQIIVLILSQDTSFSHNIHKVMLQQGAVGWYQERLLSRISLGSLLFVVLLRTAHQNVGQLQDLYLPTNTLAALANLAPQVSGLHSHAAQRLVGLASLLARRWLKLCHKAATESDGLAPPPQDIQVLGDFLRILLDVINGVLAANLGRNLELVYALLHRQEVIAQLAGQQGYAELVDNLQVVIDFFNSRLDAAKANASAAAPEGPPQWDVGAVLHMVAAFSQSWRPDKLKPLPELRFVYEEEASPEEFFVPYCWSLAVAATSGRHLNWRLESGAALLSQLSGVEVSGDGAAGQLEGQLSNASRWSEELGGDGAV